MSDMKTALKEAIKDFKSLEAAGEHPPQPTTTAAERLFEYIREHPGITAKELEDACNEYGMRPVSVSSYTGQLYQRGLLSRTKENGSFRYSTCVPRYVPGTPPMVKANRPMKVKAAAKLFAEQQAQRKKELDGAALPVDNPPVRTVTIEPHLLPVGEAYALWRKLNEYFGAKDATC